MSIFNRVVVVLIALVVLAGALITLLTAIGVTEPEVLLYGLFASQLRLVADTSGGTAATIIAVSLIIALAMLSLLFFELAPLRSPAPLLISSTEKGTTTIDVGSVCILAESAALTVHNVLSCNCSIREGLGGLLISCRASLALGSNVPEAGSGLQSKVKETIEQLIELPVARVDISTKYDSQKAGRLAVR